MKLRTLRLHTTPAERILLFVVTVLLVISIGLIIQIHHLQTSADEARNAARSAQQIVDAAVNNPANVQQAQASADAITAIHRIEQHLCGGPCPN